MHTFPENKSEYWIKLGSKLFFDFVDISELKVSIEGILDFSFYHSINLKIMSTARKKHIFTMFIGIKCSINESE